MTANNGRPNPPTRPHERRYPCRPSCCKTPLGHSTVRDHLPWWHPEACRCHRGGGGSMSAPNSEARFWAQVVPTGMCWYWEGYVTSDGYGRFSFSATSSPIVHRISYELPVGPIPPRMQLDHLCRTRNCVNPDHLEGITAEAHSLRSNRWRMSRPTCINGHARSRRNRLPMGRYYRCRQCVLVRTHRSRGKACAYDAFCAAPSHREEDD